LKYKNTFSQKRLEFKTVPFFMRAGLTGTTAPSRFTDLSSRQQLLLPVIAAAAVQTRFKQGPNRA